MTKKIITIYLIFLVMSTVFSPVIYAQEETEEEETPVYKTPFTCTVDSISAEEVEKFQDEILKSGFRGAEISSGTPPNQFREELENNTAILSPDVDKNTGLKVDLPNQKMDVEEVNYLLNNRYTGAFALGILINDTLRAGKCLEWNEAECATMGKNLTLRNSGTGIAGDFKNIWNDIKRTLDGNQQHSFSEKDLNRLNDILQVEDKNEIMAEGYSRIPMNYMLNSIMTDSLDASMATNCNDSSCRISIYSLFDKYYNSWYSGEMVVSVFAPVLWGQAKHIFGTSYRRGFFGRKWLPDIEHSSLVKNYRKKLFGPDAFWSKTRADKARNIFKKYDMHSFYNEWIEGTYFKEGMAATDAAEKLMIKYFGKDGIIKGMKSVEAQKEFMQAVLELHRYNTACKQISEEASNALARKLKLAEQMPEDAARLVRRQAYEEYGAIEADLAAAYDYYWDADFPAMLAIQERSGIFYNAFKSNRTDEFMHIPSSQDQFNEIMYNYVGRSRYEPQMLEPGKVKGMWGQFGAEEVENGALKLYKFDSRAGREVTTISKQDLKEHVLKGQYRELFAKLDNGEMMPVKHETVEHILQRVEGDVQLFEGHWTFDRLLTPEDTGRWMRDYMNNRISKSQEMTEKLWYYLREQGYDPRGRYWNLLDKMFKEETFVFKQYFTTVKGAAEWTVKPYVYWGFKKGFGFDELSAYMLPENWRQVNFFTGEEKIYDDAYIDFFSNEGSDEGDMFIRVINNLPWKYLLNVVSDQFNPAKETYNKMTTPEAGFRDEVGDLAFYFKSEQDCPECGIEVLSSNMREWNARFNTRDETQSVFLEDTQGLPEKERKKGSALIVFAHHLNLIGKDNEGAGEEINMAKAIREKETCGDKIETLPETIGVSFIHIPKGVGSTLGGAIAVSESIAYFGLGMYAVLGSVALQLLIAPHLQDCVDVDEGYFVNYTTAPNEEKEEKRNAPEAAAETATELVDEFKDKGAELFSGIGGVTKQQMEKVKEGIEELAREAEEDNLVQATLNTRGSSYGTVSGNKVFYFWTSPDSEAFPTKYNTEGKTVVTDTDTNMQVELNREEGVLKANGEPIITAADQVRMASQSNAIPGIEIPNTITKIVLPDTNDLLFEMSVQPPELKGHLIVMDERVWDCIKQGVFEQSGLELNSKNDLESAFGKVESIITTSHSLSIQDNKILANGVPRKAAENDPRVEILMNRNVKLINSNDGYPEVGLLESVQLENGVILYKPETNELIFWLRHHKDAVVNQDDVIGMKVTPTSYINPLTDCEELAFDVNLLADPDSPYAQAKIDKFNTVLEKYGPYQIFETDSKRFVFWADPEDDCKPHMKIIDKETGKEIYDGIIESVEPTADGFKLYTADGQEHDFSFGTEDGRPYLDYNGVKELLRSASGSNGTLYYDPDKGLWYADNAQLLPLIDAFKQQGSSTMVGPGGEAKSIASGNTLNVNLDGGSDLPWNLPSLPEQFLPLTLFFLMIVGSMMLIQFLPFKRKK